MNERIKLLADEAGLTFVNAITDDNEDIECVADTNGGLPCSTELEKFAELIVQECIQVGGPEDSYTDDWFKAKADSINKIKQHFGVEE